jgi:hypothetical protein
VSMSGPVRVAGFLVVLVAVFAAALGFGYAAGPVSTPTSEPMAGHDEGEEDAHAGGHVPAQDTEVPGGMMVSQDGYTLRLDRTAAAPGRDVPVSFTIVGPDGRPVTAYDVEHGKRLHLVVVRRDFTSFQHVHPTLGRNGLWSTGLALTPGEWRVFADFNPTGGVGTTLGADLAVAGDYQPADPAGEVRTARVDGYTVTLAGDLTPGADSELTLEVTRGGRPVTDLEPYLGAYGHLVALREGDLAYLHVHPDGAPGDGRTTPGPEVVFFAEVPSGGAYRLFLDFRHRGVVRTASFALSTEGVAHEDREQESHGHSD